LFQLKTVYTKLFIPGGDPGDKVTKPVLPVIGKTVAALAKFLVQKTSKTVTVVAFIS